MLAWLTLFALDAGHRFGAVAILAIVAANTVFLGGLAVFVSRARRVPIELAAFACAAIFSVWNDNHDVRLVDLPASQSDMSAVFSSWVTRAPGDPGKPIPVIVAAAEGGGIRAAYWTSLGPASPRRHSRHRRAVSAAPVCDQQRLGRQLRRGRLCGTATRSDEPAAARANRVGDSAGAFSRADGREACRRRFPAVVPARADPPLRSIERDGDGICRGLQRARPSRLDGREVHRVPPRECGRCARAAAQQHQRAAWTPDRHQSISVAAVGSQRRRAGSDRLPQVDRP